MPNRRQLNQALEKSTLMILGTADEYKNYLDHEYESNYIARKANWDRHYEEMRTAYRGHLFSVTGRGMPLKDMNIAILGPGLRPVGRDLGLTEQRVVLPEVNSVVIGDFSAWVVSEAYKQLHDEVNLRGTPVYPMQIDLTDMGSTAYSNMIRRLLDPLQDEDALEDVSKQLGSLTIDQLQMALDNERVQMVEKSVKIIDELRGRMAVPECFREGGINQYHSFALSVGPQREPLPIHSWYIPMVLAGTGAAAEHKIWETFDAVTCDPNRGARVDSE
ncbi:hypothetical protein FJZ28_05365, partial [Candidatus Peregrinibacteria bacterium]|nr:hypothetical protein [Candidatus Peregrinibacteria bacterium]